MSVIRSVFNFIWYSIATLALVVMFVIGVSIFSHKVGIYTFTVLSGSMEPAIKTGSFIVTRPLADYQVGDVVTRKAGKDGVTITHRIIAKTNQDGMTIFHTKGDANELADGENVKQSDIIGKVSYTLPYAGYPVHFSKSKIGFILLIIIPMAFIIIDESISIYKTLQRRRGFKKKKSSSGAGDNIGKITMSDTMTPLRPAPLTQQNFVMPKENTPAQSPVPPPAPPQPPRRRIV